MKGSEAKMTGFMEGADKRYVIPVYQRKYDWKYENCRQLYDDLKKIVIDGRDSHFFGSIVSAVVPNGSKIEYHIIDGQQRLTTITLLLLAIRNLIAQGKVTTNEGKLDEQISQRFLISPWASDDDKIKLRPVKSDREALVKLFGDEEDYDHSSNLTINYQFFYDMTAILPDIPDAPSGWNTDNHYFYEIINRNGKTTYIQFAISSKNITDEFRNICENINKYYPAKMGKDDWQWRTPFKTATIELGDELDKDTIVAKLDACMKEILEFEADLANKLNQ